MRINQLQPLHPDRAEHALTHNSHNTYIHTYSHTHSTQDAVQIQIIRVDTAWFILRFGRQSIVFMAKNRYLNILSMLYCVITKSYCSSSSASSLLQMAACLVSLIRQSYPSISSNRVLCKCLINLISHCLKQLYCMCIDCVVMQ